MYRRYQQPTLGTAPSTASTPALLGQVLGVVGGGFVFTAIAAYLSESLNLPYAASLVAMLIGLGLLFAVSAARANQGLSLVLFYAFAFCEGIGIGPLIGQYLRVDGPGVVVNAAATTAMGMIVLGSIAFVSSFDFRKLAGVAFGLLIALVIVSLIGAFTHFFHPGVIAWATLAVFTLLTLVDFARLKNNGAAYGAVQMATSIYLDAINIFMALLQIFGGRSRDD